MTRLSLSNASRNLLGFNGSYLGGTHKQPIKKVEGQVLESLSFILGIWIDIVRGIVTVNSRNVSEFDDFIIEDSHFSEGFDANSKSLRWLFPTKPRIVVVDVLGRYIQSLAIHSAGSLVPGHLAAFICLTEQASDAFWNMLAKFSFICSDPNRGLGQATVAKITYVSVVSQCVCLPNRRRRPFVHRELLAVRACSDDLIVVRIFPPDWALAVNVVHNVFGATPYAIPDKKTHVSPPSLASVKRRHIICFEQEAAA